MINVHLNGDIVRCPDIAESKKRLSEIRDSHGICKYNIHESTCPVWQLMQQAALNESNWDNKRNNFTGRCTLGGSENCPGSKNHKELGNITKHFKIDNVVYRKLSSATHDLVKSSGTKTLFLTLTFPKFKNEYDETKINPCFSKFIENLRTNYNCSGYVAVREYGDNTHRVHFHLCAAMPFTDFRTLNDSWCAAISDISEYSKTALRTTKDTIFIKNPSRALRYVCKYFAKSKYQVSDTRLVFISNNLIKTPINLKNESAQSILIGYKGIYINQTSDYSTMFRIINPSEFDRFCKEFLYPAFEKAYNYPLFSKKGTGFYSPGEF